jgi:putative intracellular protease/amidase
MNTIGFLLSPGFQLLDFAGPAGAFQERQTTNSKIPPTG